MGGRAYNRLQPRAGLKYRSQVKQATCAAGAFVSQSNEVEATSLKRIGLQTDGRSASGDNTDIPRVQTVRKVLEGTAGSWVCGTRGEDLAIKEEPGGRRHPTGIPLP
jgi:hypothetical protein